MARSEDWTQFLSRCLYAAPFVSGWMQADHSHDVYWLAYEQALNTYLASRNTAHSVARRYADLVDSHQRFLQLKLDGDEHIATQLALIRSYVDLGNHEEAVKECDLLVFRISGHRDIQMTRPCLAPFERAEHGSVSAGWDEWLKSVLDGTRQHLTGATSEVVNENHTEQLQSSNRLQAGTQTHTSQPLLSICIPTFNRAEKLRACLLRLKEQLERFPIDYEILISDNHSTDNTQQVVESFTDLNIRYILRDKNHGGFENARFSLKNGFGKYLCYVADDDSIRLDVVHRILLRMQASPELIACFAPAATYDVENKTVHSLFGHSKSDLFIKRGEQRKLLDYILQTHAYPEIAIYRAQEFCQAFLENSQVAYEAFIWASEILDHGDIAFLSDVYYYWHIPEFAFQGEEELNLGHVNAMNDWDRFRGGLDVILSKIIDSLSQAERQYYVLLTHRHAASMLALAIRLRYQHNYGNLNDLYYLSRRLIGMGYKSILPVSLEKIDEKLFALSKTKILITVQTMPRSGTHYLINNLQRTCPDLGYATVFANEIAEYKSFRYKDIIFTSPFKSNYVLKSHFFAPQANANLMASNHFCIYAVSFFLDSIYSWGALLTSDKESKKYVSYTLKLKSQEWGYIKNHLDGLEKWLEKVNEGYLFKYEKNNAFESESKENIDKLCPGILKSLQDSYAPDTRRIYYLSGKQLNDALHARFDYEIVVFLFERLERFFYKFYPEKASEIKKFCK